MAILDQPDRASSTIVVRSGSACIGWGGLLGAAYLPLAFLVWLASTSWTDNGDWTEHDSMMMAPLLAIPGGLAGLFLGAITGVLVGATLSGSTRRGSTRNGASLARLRAVGASYACASVTVLTGLATGWWLHAGAASVRDLSGTSQSVLLFTILPSAIAAAVVYWRAPRWAGLDA